MKYTILALSVFCSLGANNGLACMKSEEIIKKSQEHGATKKTFSTTGVVISVGDNGSFSFGSGILLDEKTVLSDAHSHQSLGENPKTYFSLSSSVNFFLNEDQSFDLSKIVEGLDGSCSSSVSKTIVHPDFKLIQNKREVSLNTLTTDLQYMLKVHNDVNDVDKALSTEKFFSDGSLSELWEGPDLSILKLSNPVKSAHGFLKLADIDGKDKVSCKGFTVGYPNPARLHNGKMCVDYNKKNHAAIMHRSILVNIMNFHQSSNLFFETLLSPGSQDEHFVPEKNTDNFSGLFSFGMSGGPLLSNLNSR